jgi:hypothetical protein
VQAKTFNWQVAHGPGNGDVNLIFNCPRMAAIAHPQEALAVIGARRNEDDVGAHLADLAAQLGKFNVVADQDGDAAMRRVEHPQVMARITVPFFFFPSRQMNFVLAEYLAFGCEQISRIEQLAVAYGGVAAAYHMHFPLRCQFLEQFDIASGVLVHIAHGLAQVAGVHERQQLGCENLGQ